MTSRHISSGNIQNTKNISKIKVIYINPDEDLIIDDLDNINGNINDNINLSNDNIVKPRHNTVVINSTKMTKISGWLRSERQNNNYCFFRNGKREITDNIKDVHIGNITSQLVIDSKSIFHDNIRSITFGPNFCSEFIYDDIMVLPQKLRSLYLGSQYNKPFIVNNKKVLPAKLKTLRIGERYEIPLIINGVRCIPKFLSRIHLADCIMDIQYIINGKSIFPKRIKSIHFPNKFNECLVVNGVKIIPDHTQYINLGNSYNKPFVIDNMHVLPNYLETLVTGNNYNQLIIINNISVFTSQKLRKITFGESYNQPIIINNMKGIPDWVEYINLGVSFCQPITNNMFPQNMKSLLFGSNLDKRDYCHMIRLSSMTNIMINHVIDHEINQIKNNAEHKNILSFDIFNNNLEYIEFPLNYDFTVPVSNFSSQIMRNKKIKIIMRYTQYINCLKYDPHIFFNKDVTILVDTFGNDNRDVNNVMVKFWNENITNYVLLRRVKYSSLKFKISTFAMRVHIYPDYFFDATPNLRICEEIIDRLPMPIADETVLHIDMNDVILKKYY